MLRPLPSLAVHCLLYVIVIVSSGHVRARESPQTDRQDPPAAAVFKATISPHWSADDGRFWYRNDLADGAREFVVVDTATGTRKEAFDHRRLAIELARATGDSDLTIDPARLPFDTIEFADAPGLSMRFVVQGETWSCDLSDYQCTRSEENLANLNEERDEQRAGRRRRRRRPPEMQRAPSDRSPDGRWVAYIEGGNLFVRPMAPNNAPAPEETETTAPTTSVANSEAPSSMETPIQLSADGSPDAPYDLVEWAADSRTLLAFRVEPGEAKEVFLLESSPPAGGRAVLHRRPYALPGDRLTSYELNLFDVAEKRQMKPAVSKLEMEWERPRIHWSRDQQRFSFSHVDRGHQRFRVTSVEISSGSVLELIDEQTATFIWTAHTENINLDHVTWLTDTDELLYVSERDGWRHVYLVDGLAGGIKQAITRGEFVVRGIDRIDEQARQLWFHASGMNPSHDPYLIHYYRVDFDGNNLVSLTAGDGDHSVQYSPQGRFLIDTYSRVDTPPIHELRRVSDGTLVCELERADVSQLQASGWRPLEPFVAKGRDGKTDICGIICRPRDYDPERRYPILESVYAGPQGSYVPKSFQARSGLQALADDGFIVVQVDGMGTANRSKAFHDVCWHDLKDAGFPDRILWIRAAAEKYPSMDLSRVGIYGGSAGGQNAAAALLFHPDFYQVAVAGCGCHDNRLDKASWNEQWMGYPVGHHYAESSNIDNAHRLQGKLMLILGEMDDNVPVESTLRFVDALIRADKDFEFVFVPGAGHGMGGAYGNRRMREFFVRHLQTEANSIR